jgi:phosphinothricin acetyltransferase
LRIERIIGLSDLTAAVEQLFPQLSDGPVPGYKALSNLLSDSNSIVWGAYDNGHYVGMLTLCLVSTVRGVRGMIEDLVVDADHRGQGVASALVEVALSHARAQKLIGVVLTAKSHRAGVDRLCHKLGFKRRADQAYGLEFDLGAGNPWSRFK